MAFFLLLSQLANAKQDKEDFTKQLQQQWQQVFYDSGSNNWQQQWFADGEQNTLKNSDAGLTFSSGDKEWDAAHHGVLWTKQSFSGDIKVTYQYTRHDTEHKWVNIIYLLATGTGEGEFDHDIYNWRHLRKVPAMKTYFNNMNLLHISYAAYGREDKGVGEDYVRARRYPLKPGQVFRTDTAFSGDYSNTGLFIPGVTYDITIIKNSDSLYMEVKGGGIEKLFNWDLSEFPKVTEGRIGLRHMWRKSVTYKHFSVYQKKS